MRWRQLSRDLPLRQDIACDRLDQSSRAIFSAIGGVTKKSKIL